MNEICQEFYIASSMAKKMLIPTFVLYFFKNHKIKLYYTLSHEKAIPEIKNKHEYVFSTELYSKPFKSVPSL